MATDKKILVIDGQGGQMGSALIKAIIKKYEKVSIMAVGTNASATAAMLKAGAGQAATGENPAIVASRKSDVIIGPVGIVIADSLLGEITPAMAVAVGQSESVKILIPTNKCNNIIAGSSDLSMTALIDDAVLKLGKVLDSLT